MASTEQGLSSVEAARRLAAYGPNEPAPVRRLSAVVQLFHLFANPLVIVAIGAVLPATPLAGFLGFTRLPVSYFAFLIPATLTYLVMVDVAKRQLVRRLGL